MLVSVAISPGAMVGIKFTSQVVNQGYQLDIGGDPARLQDCVRKLVDTSETAPYQESSLIETPLSFCLPVVDWILAPLGVTPCRRDYVEVHCICNHCRKWSSMILRR
jgi:hypothetical protein